MRTLQRVLKALAGAGAIEAEGKGRARRYRFGTPGPSAEPARLPVLPLSEEAVEIEGYVRGPRTERRPIGYQPFLLEGYRPNVTAYLPLRLRQRLMVLGALNEEQRVAGTYARALLDRLLIDLSWASSRLEGNTYDRLDTQNLIERGEVAEGRDRSEAQMILNHKRAIELLVENPSDIGFNRHTLFNLHAVLSDNLLSDPTEAGRLRRRAVEIGGSVYAPLDVPQIVEQYFELLLEKAEQIEDPFEQAFFAMVHIPYLQPFIDVNKRVSRLAANIPFIRLNLCPLSFVEVPEESYVRGTLGVYELARIELLRDVFAWAYERSSQRFGALRSRVAEPDPFRLQHRAAVSELVGEIVRGLKSPTRENVEPIARTLVAIEDVERLTEHGLADLADLHEGNLARHRLRLSEYRARKDR